MSGQPTGETVQVRVVECKKATELPKGPLWCYVAQTLEAARGMHELKSRALPGVIYHLGREWYFPVVE